MTTKNNLDKVFGPVGSSAGIFLVAAGAVITYFSLSGLILVLIGAFIGFTSTCTLIDVDKKRLKFATALFGIVPIGQWMVIQADMKIGINKSTKIWRAYSQSNRSLDISRLDYRLILYDAKGRALIPLQKTNSMDSATSAMKLLGEQLGLDVILIH